MPGKKRYLVTGGAGFIGSHLTERLLAEGARVTVVDDLSTGRLENLASAAKDPRLDVHISSVSGCVELPRIVREVDGVYHLAAAVGVRMAVERPLRTIRTNLDETEAVIELASARRIPVLLASSSEVYGKSRRLAFGEEDDLLIGPPHFSRWSYACSKLMDEFMALACHKEQGLPVVIARLFNVVGPRQGGEYGMVLPRFIQAAREGKPLRVYGDGRQTRCFCYVDDTVEALIRLMRLPAAAGEVFNVGGTEEITIRALAERVIRLLESRSEIELVPYEEAYPPGFEDMRRRRPSVEKLRKFVGFAPSTPIDKIIRLTAGLD
ncbi:MAG: NAD-dependent epimerase/dehydratase family protein [Verrucomicrobia bacterium]|nr:NAD-dependent epimerase/dehydratase family protein [Verrucomicrobiota bacterium]